MDAYGDYQKNWFYTGIFDRSEYWLYLPKSPCRGKDFGEDVRRA